MMQPQKTDRMHRARPMRKVDVDSLAGLVRAAERSGIQPDTPKEYS